MWLVRIPLAIYNTLYRNFYARMYSDGEYRIINTQGYQKVSRRYSWKISVPTLHTNIPISIFQGMFLSKFFLFLDKTKYVLKNIPRNVTRNILQNVRVLSLVEIFWEYRSNRTKKVKNLLHFSELEKKSFKVLFTRFLQLFSSIF